MLNNLFIKNKLSRKFGNKNKNIICLYIVVHSLYVNLKYLTNITINIITITIITIIISNRIFFFF
jgi:hypothetical protein